ETDAIAHVVRCFADDNVVHVAGALDPVSDIETINTELALADLASVDKQLAKRAKAARAGGDKEAQRLVAALEKVAATLNDAKPARSVDLYPEERALLQPLFLLTMKPAMYIANVAEHGFADNAMLAAVEALAKREGAPVVAEVITVVDDSAGEGEQGAKEAGKMRLEGREYVVRDGDVMHFRFNV